MVTALLDAHADATIFEKAGHDALHLAAAAGRAKCVSALLQVKSVGINQQTKDSCGSTPLHLACERCNTEVVNLLLKGKADPKLPTARDANKIALNLFLSAAANWGPFRGLSGVINIAKELAQKSWAPKAVVAEAGVSICDLALWPAADERMLRVTESLLALLAECGLDRPTVLSAAMLKSITTAIDQSPAADRRDDNRVRYAHTPGAVATGLRESMRCALRLGANARATDANRDTALHILIRFPAERRILPADQAVGEAIAGTIRLFLEHGASVNSLNKKGEKPIVMVKKLQDMGEEYCKAWEAILADGSLSSRKEGDRSQRSSPRKSKEEKMQHTESTGRMLPVLSVTSLTSSANGKDSQRGNTKGVLHSNFHLPTIGK